jgi:hypothetical protein
MVAGAGLTTDGAIHAGGLKTISSSWAQKQVIDPQARVSLPSVPQVMPERVHRLCGMKGPHRVHPSLVRQRSKGGSALRLNQCVLVPGFGGIDVVVSGNDVIVSREYDGHSAAKSSAAKVDNRRSQASL